jgi:DNA-binding MarR family transcriptional regulator
MERFAAALNDILIETYHNIMCVEENFLKNHKRINITIREMHLLECVGADPENGKTISEIAEYLKIARPSVTVAVNKLEKKGFIVKRGSDADGRVVKVFLSRRGKAVEMYHHLYHVNMAQELEKVFDDKEKDILIRAIERLNDFFKNSIGGTEA